MLTDMSQRQTPEERELSRKRAELARLETVLLQREVDLATLQAELRAFEGRYLGIVGVRYAALDEIEAQIAEAQARLRPGDHTAQRGAAQARAEAQESAQAAKEAGPQLKFTPSDSLKKTFREVAKRLHPDLTTDEKERARRQRLMAEANRAYADGDEARLQAILREWEESPESVTGEGPGAELIRVIRKIAQVEERLRTIEAEMARLKASELFQLKSKVEEAEAEGRDLLAEMARLVDQRVAVAHKRLSALSRKGQGT
jgi:predicted transcriptional regulator